MRRWRVPSGTLALAPFLVLVALPVGLALGTAALYSVGAVGLVADGVSLDAWRRVAAGGEAAASFALSGSVATTVVALAVGIALPIALVLRASISRGPLGGMLYAPLAIPAVVGAFVTFHLLTPSGLVGRWLAALGVVDGLAGVPVVINDRWAVGIVVAHVGLAVPFLVLLLAELYRSERVAALSALARSLGAGRRTVRWRVEVPVLLRAVAPQAALLWVAVFGSYEIPLLLGRQAPQMVSVLTLRTFERYNLADKPEAFVLAVVYAAVVGGVLALALRRRRVVAS